MYMCMLLPQLESRLHWPETNLRRASAAHTKSKRGRPRRHSDLEGYWNPLRSNSSSICRAAFGQSARTNARLAASNCAWFNKNELASRNLSMSEAFLHPSFRAVWLTRLTAAISDTQPCICDFTNLRMRPVGGRRELAGQSRLLYFDKIGIERMHVQPASTISANHAPTMKYSVRYAPHDRACVRNASSDSTASLTRLMLLE